MGTVEITLWQLAAAYIFVIILLIIFKIRHISKKKTLVLATFRMTIQLLIAGYLLTLAFSHPSWWLTLTIFCGMLVYAGFTIRHRAPKQYRPIVSKAAFLGMICGTSIVMIYFLSLVLGVKPWYDTRSFISIAGMIVANSMTGVLLCMNTLISDVQQNRAFIEQSLMLGASASKAIKPSVDSAFTTAILPTITNMLTMGIIALPGMMTGQILAGVSPQLAVRYQIGIMLAIMGSTVLCTIIFLGITSRKIIKMEFDGIE